MILPSRSEIERVIAWSEGLLELEESLKKQQGELAEANKFHTKELDEFGIYQKEVREHQQQLNDREDQILLKEKAIQRGQESLAEEKLRVKQREEDLVLKEQRLEDRDKKLIKKSQDIQEKWTQLQELELEKQKLKEKEEIIEKQIVIDRERKEILDMREKQLDKEKIRLQKIAEGLI